MAGSGTAHLRPAGESVLRIENLLVEFPVGRSGLKVNAVTNVSIDVLPGETLGLVGESGCGKSTMGKAVMQLVHATSGSVLFEGKELTTLSGGDLREVRPKLQMIFQDPISSLNPRRRVRDIVREGLDIWKIGDKPARAKRVDEVLETVGIDPAVAGPKRPHEFSGGQCQRISIARAVATNPKLIICDEPVSALDVSVQAQILNLLEDMKRQYGLTLIFIAHDLAVVKNVSDKVAVMYLGKLCEFADPDTLYAQPAHPYTAALLSAIPEPDPDANRVERGGVGGEIPSPLSPPSGCRFRTRCPAATEICASDEPMMREVRPAHFVACHHPLGDITVTAPAENTATEVPAIPAPAEAAVTAAASWAAPEITADSPSALTPEPTAHVPPPLTPEPPASTGSPMPPAFIPDPPTSASPVAASTPPAFAPEASAPEPNPAPEPESLAAIDTWLTQVPTPKPADEPLPPVVDWTPEPPAPPAEPAPVETPSVASTPVVTAPPPPPSAAPVFRSPEPAVVETPVPPSPPEAAPPAAEIADEDAEFPPPVPVVEPPSAAALDTLLPSRNKGGSVKPKR